MKIKKISKALYFLGQFFNKKTLKKLNFQLNDNATEKMISESLDALSVGRTTIVVAHRLSTVKKADEIIVMTDDGIKERGSHDELIKIGGIYKELYDYQFRT